MYLSHFSLLTIFLMVFIYYCLISSPVWEDFGEICKFVILKDRIMVWTFSCHAENTLSQNLL